MRISFLVTHFLVGNAKKPTKWEFVPNGEWGEVKNQIKISNFKVETSKGEGFSVIFQIQTSCLPKLEYLENSQRHISSLNQGCIKFHYS